MDYVLSQDLGKMHDYHATVLTKVVFADHRPVMPGGIGFANRRSYEEPLYSDIHVLWIERSQVPYNTLVADVKTRLHDSRLHGNCFHLVDATGVGMPVLDMMRESGLSPIGVWITGGGTSNTASYGYTVPKEELISSLQMVLSSERLKFSDQLDPELVAQLRHEFMQFREKKTKSLNTTFEAWRESDHDDLVLSLAINVWWVLKSIGKPRYLSDYTGRDDSGLDSYDPLSF